MINFFQTEKVSTYNKGFLDLTTNTSNYLFGYLHYKAFVNKTPVKASCEESMCQIQLHKSDFGHLNKIRW